MAERAPTRAQLLAQLEDRDRRLEEAAERARELREERDRWRDAHQGDREAEAIAGCVRSLDTLKGTDLGYGVHNDSMRRVLRFLADRYGVCWYDPPAPSPTSDDRLLLALQNIEGEVRQAVR